MPRRIVDDSISVRCRPTSCESWGLSRWQITDDSGLVRNNDLVGENRYQLRSIDYRLYVQYYSGPPNSRNTSPYFFDLEMRCKTISISIVIDDTELPYKAVLYFCVIFVISLTKWNFFFSHRPNILHRSRIFPWRYVGEAHPWEAEPEEPTNSWIILWCVICRFRAIEQDSVTGRSVNCTRTRVNVQGRIEKSKLLNNNYITLQLQVSYNKKYESGLAVDTVITTINSLTFAGPPCIH